jgi:hypothetical protein
MLLECDNCGAPLDVKDGVRRAKCNYCGQSKAVGELGRVAERTPEGWQPPQQWSPPAHSRLAGQSLSYKPIRAIGRTIALAIRLGILAIVGTAVWRVVTAVNHVTNNLSSSAESAALQGAVTRALGEVAQKIDTAAQQSANSGDGPISCSGVEVVTITGRTIRAEGAAGVPLTASGNCRAKVVASHLTGTSAIVVRDNARVSVEGGSLTGVKMAVALSGNAALDVSGGALLTGAPAITATGNARATLRDASVNGAVDTRENASVDAVGARILGPVTGTKHVRK